MGDNASKGPPKERSLPEVEIVGVEPVGNYGYQITFSDGHETGIYSLALLRQLGRVSGHVSGGQADGRDEE